MGRARCNWFNSLVEKNSLTLTQGLFSSFPFCAGSLSLHLYIMFQRSSNRRFLFSITIPKQEYPTLSLPCPNHRTPTPTVPHLGRAQGIVLGEGDAGGEDAVAEARLLRARDQALPEIG